MPTDTNGPPAPAAPANGRYTPPPPPDAARPARPRAVPEYTPFPTYALPAALRPFVREVATAIGCDEAYVGVPVLAAAAAAVGNTRQVRLKRGWTEPAVVWAAVVGGSGVRKSPPFRAAMRPLVEAEMRYRDEYKLAEARYQALPPEQREGEPEPRLRRILTEDITIESVAQILLENPRGLVNARDEIEDWFQGLVRYKGKGGGSDRARWLKLSNADTLTVDRKTAEPHLRHLFVPVASCSICGTIQPGVLAAALDRQARESGLAARLLLAMPDYVKRYWTDAEIDPDTERGYADVLDRLLGLTMTGTGRGGRPHPHVLGLDAEAKPRWVEFYNRIQDRKFDAAVEHRAVLAKLEGYAARFALVHHLVGQVTAGADGLASVGPESVEAGVHLSEWFAREALRIYLVLGESDEDRAERELVDWIRARGGRCTKRDLYRARPASYPDDEAAGAVLETLATAGWGAWEEERPAGKGGRPTTAFVLSPLAVIDTDRIDETPRDGEGGD